MAGAERDHRQKNKLRTNLPLEMLHADSERFTHYLSHLIEVRFLGLTDFRPRSGYKFYVLGFRSGGRSARGALPSGDRRTTTRDVAWPDAWRGAAS